jgi:hypothetical protein
VRARAHTHSCIYLIAFGVIAKISAIINTIPYSVLGGMTTFLFCNIVVSGIGILGPELQVRRSRFIVCSSLMFGIGVALVPQWADNDLVRASGDKNFQFMGRAVVILLNTPYCIGTIVGACSIPPSLIASLALHYRHCMRAAPHNDGLTVSTRACHHHSYCLRRASPTRAFLLLLPSRLLSNSRK